MASPASEKKPAGSSRRIGNSGTRRARPRSARFEPVSKLKDVTTPVPRVLLSVTLAGPAPSGSTETSRLCQGCSRPPRHHPDQPALSYADLLRQANGEGLSPPLEPSAPQCDRAEDLTDPGRAAVIVSPGAVIRREGISAEEIEINASTAAQRAAIGGPGERQVLPRQPDRCVDGDLIGVAAAGYLALKHLGQGACRAG